MDITMPPFCLDQSTIFDYISRTCFLQSIVYN